MSEENEGLTVVGSEDSRKSPPDWKVRLDKIMDTPGFKEVEGKSGGESSKGGSNEIAEVLGQALGPLVDRMDQFERYITQRSTGSEEAGSSDDDIFEGLDDSGKDLLGRISKIIDRRVSSISQEIQSNNIESFREKVGSEVSSWSQKTGVPEQVGMRIVSALILENGNKPVSISKIRSALGEVTPSASADLGSKFTRSVLTRLADKESDLTSFYNSAPPEGKTAFWERVAGTLEKYHGISQSAGVSPGSSSPGAGSNFSDQKKEGSERKLSVGQRVMGKIGKR